MIKLFITGTDTNVGKTYVSVNLLKALHAQGLSTLGLKPIASGCNQHGYNEDALQLQAASSLKLSYALINPYSFEPPIAPQIAARLKGTTLSVQALTQALLPAFSQNADICIIEGAGGWYTPLNEKETLADFVKIHQLPTLLVVGMRLGCLNHALLTLEGMKNANVMGWVANCMEPDMPFLRENINCLLDRLPAPHLGTISHGEKWKAEKVIAAFSR